MRFLNLKQSNCISATKSKRTSNIMAAKNLRIKLYKLWNLYQKSKTEGLTLTELLVTIIIASIVFTGLLSAVVELMQTDQREAIRTQTQQEMQMALDYIADDLRESVYIYDSFERDPGTNDDDLTNFLPDFGANVTPVLAFWKAEAIDDEELPGEEDESVEERCADFATDALRAECQALQLRRRAYSLVIYLQSTRPSDTWEGKSRIMRYQLPMYTDSENLERSDGFVDPADNRNFPTWPNRDGRTLQATRPSLPVGGPPVLVDFVDDPMNPSVEDLPPCRSNYTRLPNDDNSTDLVENNSFFACVRNVGNNLGLNQDIVLYLRGNAEERGLGGEGFLPTLQTQVTLRGVIDKFN